MRKSKSGVFLNMNIKNAQLVLEKSLGNFSFAMFILGMHTTLNLSQVVMAKRLGISRSALCEIEKGRKLVSPRSASRYAKKAGFSERAAI